LPMINIKERRMVAKPIEILEDIPLDESNPEKFTRIIMSIEEKMKQDLVNSSTRARMCLLGAMKTCMGLT